MKMIVAVLAVILVVFYFYNKMNTKKLAQKNLKLGAEFLAFNQTQDSVKTTDSGLQYQLLTPGEGKVHPKSNSKVKVHYHGTLIDGTVFDSSVERGQPISFGLNQVISGWTEGVQLMVVGDKMKFVIPSNLAYGNQNAGKIKAGSTLIFEVELIEIQ
ncbi:FKBP-type peptidyl-prolyl cis-trans isomerase [Pseudoalteromonas denitrificans]|uniref:Peptidyl-prolyl cis-trans isomerase n=1 Tax=Pseudoalteromonas denitrificans DSM 6059 TaxID=1123010 RepID=A0A1I1GPM4_9GAMM|nr:FKBP-type peptidyl-prolyl cis-trans isomerase [Pseudoalteromonas denitrificans]SFC13719.1 peptidylprolyl isomerase [Pseudoalteromonas denitrificans DSM 6059]